MKPRRLFVVLCLLMVMITGARIGSAQEGRPLEPKWLRQMHAEGWRKVQEGVLQRDREEGFETFSYGAEGLQWIIQGYEQQVRFLEDRYTASPSENLANAIEKLDRRIDSLYEDLGGAPSADSFDAEALVDCTDIVPYGGTPFVGPVEAPQGVTATASVYYHSNCGYVADTHAVAYAEASDGTGLTSNTDIDSQQGTWIDGTATASMSGSSACYSYAQAQVHLSGDLIYEYFKEHHGCPAGVEASITGPTQVTTDYYGVSCADVTWTASANGGSEDFTYTWYIGEALEGTGPTLTKTYCNENANIAVRVVAQDSAGWSGDATFTTVINHIDPIVASASGPTSVTTDYYINSGCADVTWTASATGGHPGGHTYSWYIGTDPTVQGTGSTFTKSYCNTSQSVTVKVVASDSDGHTDDETFTTIIVVIPPVEASVSGPTSVTTDFYNNSGCADVTWTANATGGHTGGYTYSWYIGTDPTVQGTGSTFTRSYCKTSQSVTVKAVARDSDGHTDDATFTTNINYKPAIVAKITGPTSVSSSTSCTTVSWTASVTSTGHSGFSYQWFIGTTPQTTGTSFSKQFCSSGGSSQSVTVKVTATASDGHQDNDNHTTSITFPPPPTPPTASISGPATVQLATSTECKSITWTASVTGGTPGYTYSWYIGTSTTVQGTAATLTKSYCGPQTINVKVVVRDSAAQTDDATFTTTLSVPALTASISGQDYVDIYGATTCADLTWTANVSGGTPAYSYSWTIGTSTTVLSTTSTLTRRVCTSQTLNVKLTARDSASRTANATFTTTVIKDSTCFANCP